jgi:hypothetical protein
VTIVADITYPNNREVQNGLYTAAIYSEDLSGDLVSITTELMGVPLNYDSTLEKWTATFTLPSPEDPSPNFFGSVEVGPQGYSGPYCIFISGISADGVPVTSDPSYQYTFYVQPEQYNQPFIGFANPISGNSYTSSVPVNVEVLGTGIVNVTFYVDSEQVASYATGGTFTFTLDTSSLSDGMHTITVVAFQANGEFNEAQVYFTINSKSENTGNESTTALVLASLAICAFAAIAVIWLVMYYRSKAGGTPALKKDYRTYG